MQTTSNRSHDSDFLRVTHPFHPLAGQLVLILFERKLKWGGRAYTCDAGAFGNATLHESYTDRGMTPANTPLTVEVLADLLILIGNLRKGIDGVAEETKLV